MLALTSVAGAMLLLRNGNVDAVVRKTERAAHTESRRSWPADGDGEGKWDDDK